MSLAPSCSEGGPAPVVLVDSDLGNEESAGLAEGLEASAAS